MMGEKKRVIIAAAGKGSRWDNYLGIDKHFVEIDGEPIIKRTVRLLNKMGIDDICVVGPDDRYKIEGSELYIPKLTPEYYDADKFLSSKDLWLEDGKTILLFGDVYFTERALDTIVNHSHQDWLAFGRPFESEITGGCGEIFAHSFYPGHIREHEAALNLLVDYYNRDILQRISGWEHYRVMVGMSGAEVRRHIIADRFVIIDDWTDDFDIPERYEMYLSKKRAFKKCPLCGKDQ